MLMSQEKNWGARQNATQQVQMTQEELQKTQVLNLQAVEAVARYERRTSKKPAIFVGILGILLLVFGSSYHVYNQYQAKKAEEKRIESRKTEVKKDPIKEVVCRKLGEEAEKGVDTDYTIQYTFEDKVLTKIVKTHLVKSKVGDERGPKEVEALISAYQPFLISISGYQVTVEPNAEKTELTTITTLDFKNFDPETVLVPQQNYFTTRIDFEPTDDEMKIKSEMIQEGFTCQ